MFTIDANTTSIATGLLAFATLVFLWWSKRSDDKRKVAQDEKMAMIVAEVKTAAAKVETVAVTAGVAANRSLDTQRDMKAGAESRTQILEAVVAKVDDVAVVVAEVKKTTAEIHILSNGTMGLALATGLEAAQGRYDAVPTPENKAKLEAAQKKFDEHAAKERLVEAKSSGAK